MIEEEKVRALASALVYEADRMIATVDTALETRRKLRVWRNKFDGDGSDFDTLVRVLSTLEPKWTHEWLFNVIYGALAIGEEMTRSSSCSPTASLRKTILAQRNRELGQRPKSMPWHERAELIRSRVAVEHPNFSDREIARAIDRCWKAEYPKLVSQRAILEWLKSSREPASGT